MRKVKSDWTVREHRALDRMERALNALPESICLYVVDGGSIIACKKGVGSSVLSESMYCSIDAGSMLCDIHDGDGKGEQVEEAREERQVGDE